ncbi:hypothetical protein [Noviherbaspirillum malthae]|uniref:hypothetical protein n=1 Tax=Noviherbaspirillum malthae TaxID=1260987 RepID=UPI00188EB9DD|nr:hypothetical protein [Noviherbaspirillum malthae]
MVASHLLEEKGRGLLESTQLEEVKAKDVFNAQSVLPESRHRKLISLSQGFQAIRQRLHGIMQKLAAIPQHAQFAAPTSRVEKEESTTDKAAVDQSISQPSARPRKARPSPVADAPSVVEQEIAAVTATGKAQTQEPVSEDTSKLEASAPVGKQTQQAARRDVPSPVQRPVHATQRRHSGQMPSQDSGSDLIELARPFVAMVCEEFANALVKTLTEKGGQQTIASFLQAVAPDAAASSVYRQQDHRASAQSVRNEGLDSASMAPQAFDDEDAHLAETDVQPLFDPKLPPSANSAFKPMIALIATSTRDFEDLKQFYPQLELNVVALDDLRTAPSLRSCQRMIGLREDIPAAADEFLRKTFRNRYVRITGGIGQIREQLNTWLDNPVTMNTGAPSWPRKQGNAKGQGAGYPKKKQFRRPRPTP